MREWMPFAYTLVCLHDVKNIGPGTPATCSPGAPARLPPHRTPLMPAVIVGMDGWMGERR